MTLFELSKIINPGQEYLLYEGNPEVYSKLDLFRRKFMGNFDPEYLDCEVVKIIAYNDLLEIYLRVGW